jgi:3-hydroxyisobutyrate dehydrogenase
MTAVGFIGLGKMGAPMAARLCAAGHDLTVLDASAEATAAFLAANQATKALSARALASGSDVVITMLPTSAIVAQVLHGADGVLAGMQPNALVIEMSSGVPATTQALAEDVRRAGGVLVDAPVSGGVARALTGELAIMVGGPDDAVARSRPILAAMGTSILPTGAVGTAHAMKALNNLVSAAGLLVSVEALLIGKRFGLDPAVMVDVLNASTGMNNSTQKKLKPFVLSRRFDSGFGLELMVKDLSIALSIARDGAIAAPLSSLTRELWAAALAMQVGPDHTEIARLSERLAGLEL